MTVTIGPFTNTPAPGDPIRSAWAQQITRYVVNRPFAFGSSAVQATANPSVNTPLVLSGATVTADPYSMWTAGGLLIPVGYGGLYQVNVSFSIGSHNGGKPVAVFVHNAAGLAGNRVAMTQEVPSGADGKTWSTSAVVLMAAGATISFGAYNLNPSAIAVGVQFLSVAYLGGTGGAPQ